MVLASETSRLKELGSCVQYSLSWELGLCTLLTLLAAYTRYLKLACSSAHGGWFRQLRLVEGIVTILEEPHYFPLFGYHTRNMATVVNTSSMPEHDLGKYSGLYTVVYHSGYRFIAPSFSQLPAAASYPGGCPSRVAGGSTAAGGPLVCCRLILAVKANNIMLRNI